ncbi:MAG: transcription termination/antitermination protein NusG [Candidatus Margulisiibacteriota bacterium]|jgi:transcriptional antiterminator NusG
MSDQLETVAAEQLTETIESGIAAPAEAVESRPVILPADTVEAQAVVETPAESKTEVEEVKAEAVPAKEGEAADRSDDDLKGQWYILHTYSGYEKKVEIGIMQTVEKEKLGDRVFKVVIPEEDMLEVKDGKRIEKTRKTFPGYAFINMIVDDEVWSMVRRIPGVLKFVGPGNRPEPVSDEEMLKVLRRMGLKAKRVEVDFEVGEMIKIVGGPFRGYTGMINEINEDKGKLKTLLSIFGRETPVELAFDQVEKGT